MLDAASETALQAQLKTCRSRVEAALSARLPAADSPPQRLHEAMRYAVLNGGKRVRASLVYMTGQAVGADDACLDAPAAAVEVVHAYSLVHDDLPAMDDDDLRRGQPTCHIAFDEATALLAGDALQTAAFEILAAAPELHGNASIPLAMVATLASASGSAGMAAGQAIDLASVGKTITLGELENMHLHKTGALIRASVKLGALARPGVPAQTLDALDRYARAIGLAFQIHDDILDVVGDTEVLGKQQGADEALNKPTYPSLVGLDRAREMAQAQHQAALDALAGMDERADPLRRLSAYIISRAN